MSERRIIEVVAYDARWPERFRLEAEAIARVFSGVACAIEHIGSTAVPGLAAKPIIDILLGAPALADIEARIPAIERLAYVYVPEYEDELPERRYFQKLEDGVHRGHLHAVEKDGAFWRKHLLFRDTLRARPDVCAAYAKLKRELAGRFRHDPAGYTNAKSDFILGVIERARRGA